VGRLPWVWILVSLFVAGCSTGAGDGNGGSGGTAPAIMDMQTVDGGGDPRSGFPRGSQYRLNLLISDPEQDAAGGWISYYAGNDATPFYGPEPFTLEPVSAESGIYQTSLITIPLDLPAGRYRFATEVYDSTNLTSQGIYVWADVL